MELQNVAQEKWTEHSLNIQITKTQGTEYI